MEYWNPEKIVRCGVKIDAHIYIIIVIIPSKFGDQYYGPCAKQGWWYQLKRQKLGLNSMVNGDDSLPSHHYPHGGRLYWHAYKSSTLQTASQVRDCSLQHQQNKIITVSTAIVPLRVHTYTGGWQKSCPHNMILRSTPIHMWMLH